MDRGHGCAYVCGVCIGGRLAEGRELLLWMQYMCASEMMCFASLMSVYSKTARIPGSPFPWFSCLLILPFSWGERLANQAEIPYHRMRKYKCCSTLEQILPMLALPDSLLSMCPPMYWSEGGLHYLIFSLWGWSTLNHLYALRVIYTKPSVCTEADLM